MNELTQILSDNDLEKLISYMKIYGDDLHKRYSNISLYEENDPLIQALKLNNEAFYLFVSLLGFNSPKDIFFDYAPRFREINLFEVAIIEGNMDFLIHGFNQGELSLSAKNLSICALNQPLSFTQQFYYIGSQIEDIKIVENLFIRNMLLDMVSQFNEKHSYSKDLAENFFFFKEYFKEDVNDRYVLTALFSLCEEMNLFLKQPQDLRDNFLLETMNISTLDCFILISSMAKFKESNHRAMHDIFTSDQIKQIYTHFFTSLHNLDDYKIEEHIELFSSKFFQNMLNENQDLHKFLCIDNPFLDMRFLDQAYLKSCRDNKSLSAHYQKVKIDYDLKNQTTSLLNKNYKARL